MFANNFFLIFENFLKYGFLIKENVGLSLTKFVKVSINPMDHAYYIAAIGLGWFYIVAYAIEYMSYSNRISKSVVGPSSSSGYCWKSP